MSILYNKTNQVSSVTTLTGQDIIIPAEGMQFIQSGDNCGVIILETNFVPIRACCFCIQTGKGGLYLLNNSAVSYSGNRFLVPNKMHNLNIVKKDNGWKMYCDSGYSPDNNVVISWTELFNSKVTGAPPLAARKYAIFINGIYNTILSNANLFDQAVVNESANSLAATLLPSIDVSSVYNNYPKLSGPEKTAVLNSVVTYLALPSSAIPSNATNPAYVLPSPEQTKWNGTNPVLPNWKPSNISYLANTFTDSLSDPATTMADDAKSLQSIIRTSVTDEIARHFANTPPPAHLISITCSMLAEKDWSALKISQVLSMIAIGLADAGLFAWTIKYTYWGARPFQYISGYSPLITTPNFPGYISGHSTFSASWDQIIGMLVPSLRNISKYVADLSGISRLYGGIHFSDDNILGLSSGRTIGSSVYGQLSAKYRNNEAFL